MSLLNTRDLSNLTGAKQLVDTLVASGITTSNITFKGVNGAVGTFTGGIGAGIGIESGIVLSTGQIRLAVSTNTAGNVGIDNQQPGDTDLNTIVGSLGTFDAAVLEFDFIPQSSEVSFSYVFASEEYPEYVGTRFNDVFAFYLNGQNIALVPGTTTPVAINTINGGGTNGTPATNSSFFVPNYGTAKDIQFDGFTTVLSATATGLVPGVASRIKLAIADTADGSLDSAVFVQASSFGNATLVTVAATDDQAKEGRTPDQGVFTITRTGSTAAPLTVSYSLSGSASSADYNTILSTVTIPAGSASTTVRVIPVDDTLIEGNETVILSLTDTNSYDLGRQNSGTVIIGDNESENIVVSLSVAPPSVVEDGTGNLVYTFTRASGTSTPIDLTSPLTVNYNVGGSATFNSDYTQTGAASFSSTTGTITFAAGSATATLTIDPTVDTTIESNETVALTLASGSGYSVNTATAVTGTIVDDDTPAISLSLNSTSVTEDGTSNLVYTFTRTGSTISGLTVNYGVSGTALLNDYVVTGAASFTATTGTITFAPGSSTATVTINPTADNNVENNETVALTIAPGTGYTVATTTAVTGIIVNDDTRVTLAVNNASVAEDGTINPVYTFTRTGVTTNALTVNYSVAGTANSTDYTGTTPGTGRTITFAAGATTATLTIDPTADIAVETDETVALTLASGTGYTVGTTTAVTSTIVNDDTSVTLAVTPARVDENGRTNLVYTFTRTGVTSNALTVNYSVGGTATFNADYTPIGATSFTGTTGTITFAAGATTATLTIDPTADIALESDETVDLTLVPGTGYIPGTTTAVTGTIVNAINCGHGWGDVHMITFDQRYYDFQAVGEFIFVESPNGDFQLQTRQKPWVNNRNVSVNRAFATRLGGSNVVFDAELAVGQELTINGVTTALTSGQSLSVGNSQIQRQGNQYTLTYAGPDGVLSTSDDDEVTVGDFDSYLNIKVCPADYRGSQIQGLLGNADGITANDFALRDGTSLGANPSWRTIHTTYADSWRITQNESLFVIPTFADKTLPEREVTLGTLPRGQANDAVRAAFNAGLPAGPILDGAALDAAATGDNRFITDAATTFADVLVRPDQRGSLITLDIAPTSVNEDGTQNLVYTFTRTGNSTDALTVNYNVGGTATVGTDYTQTGAASFSGTTGSVTFAAGATTATVTIDPTADKIVERNETVALSLASGTGYVIGGTPAVIGTIVNDDSPTINLSADRTVVEGTTSPQTVSYTLTLSDASTKTITVQYATANGTAAAGLDYTSVTGTLTFNPGVTSQVINIPILNDSINEADETFTLTLSSPTNVNLGTATTVTTITDTLTASVTTTLAANVENLTLTGTSAINGTGNTGDNILTGNTASNSLSGGAGNDILIGGGGDDRLNGGAGNDSLIGGVGNNTYSFPATTALGSDTITEVEAGGIDIIDFTGTTVAVNVNLSATTAQRVNSNLNLSLSANNVIENVTGGTGSDRITGNTLNNTLNGGNGNDQLQGLAGNDILWGGAGNDILSGGSGNDQYLFQGTGSFTTALGVDYINEFVTGQDQILLSQATFNAITNVVGQPFTDFAVVADDQLVDASNARIVYSQNTGSLFYNQNGNVLGATGVFVFASLGNPDITLTPNDFSLVV